LSHREFQTSLICILILLASSLSLSLYAFLACKGLNTTLPFSVSLKQFSSTNLVDFECVKTVRFVVEFRFATVELSL